MRSLDVEGSTRVRAPIENLTRKLAALAIRSVIAFPILDEGTAGDGGGAGCMRLDFDDGHKSPVVVQRRLYLGPEIGVLAPRQEKSRADSVPDRVQHVLAVPHIDRRGTSVQEVFQEGEDLATRHRREIARHYPSQVLCAVPLLVEAHDSPRGQTLGP